MPGRVLAVAESDSCGAAGVQADIKTILALGGYAATALTAVAAQSTAGVEHLHALEPGFVAQQMRAVLEDIGADVIKTGFLVNKDIVNAVADVLWEDRYRNIPVVVDPAIIAREGGQLMDEQAIAALKRRLFVRTTVLTPNLREAELLTGLRIRDPADMHHAADMMRTLGAERIVLKAGPGADGKAVYLLATMEERRVYERPVLDTPNTLGAGATLASAIAVGLTQKTDFFQTVERALDFMHQAMLHAPDLGRKAGPVGHVFDVGGPSVSNVRRRQDRRT
ncbi:MAG: bifunctional hydroxymethylpyrimidine kinase/phosphomethylpyrimidine kinase [Pseudomonadota bacterium]